MAKPKRATWWKMFYHQRAVIESVSDKEAGMGLKAAFRYFDGEEIAADDLTPQAFTIFCAIRPYLDESMRDYEEAVKNGKNGAENRWGDSPPIAPLSPSIGCLREAEAISTMHYAVRNKHMVTANFSGDQAPPAGGATPYPLTHKFMSRSRPDGKTTQKRSARK